MRRVAATIGLVVLASSAAAAEPRRAEARLAEAFWARRLTEARTWHAALVATEPAPAPGEVRSSHFWRELLLLVDCVPPTLAETRAPTGLAGEWAVRTALVRLERLRLRRALAGEPVGPGADLLDSSFFSRPSPSAPERDYVRWPAVDELWDDELPLLDSEKPRCRKSRAPDAKLLARWLGEELALATVLATSMRASHPARVRLVLHRSALLLRLDRVDDALAAARPLFGRAEVTGQERHHVLLLEAIDRERAGDPAGAIDRYSTLLEVAPMLRARPFVQLRVGAALLAAGRHDDLLATLPDAVDVRTPAGRYDAWLRARAYAALNRPDALLAIARAGLRGEGAEPDDPSLRALADVTYAFLAGVPFDDRVLELIESLGDPRELYGRLDRFARVAIDREEPAVAEQALKWLLAHHANGEYRPRYESGLARLAFDREDLPEFTRLLGALAAPNEKLLEVIPPARRGAFWAERDARLLGLVRYAVPRLPERTTPGFPEAVVQTLQQFLRTAPESRTIEAMTELYRTARASGPSTAAAYSERIGGRTPAVALGEVRIPRPLAEPPPPSLPTLIDEPASLLAIPSAGAPDRLLPWFGEEGA